MIRDCDRELNRVDGKPRASGDDPDAAAGIMYDSL